MTSASQFHFSAGCDQIEVPSFVNRFGDLAPLPASAAAAATAADMSADGSVVPPTHGLAATNLLAARKLRDLLVLPSRTREPYGTVVRMLDDTKHLAAVSDRRRDSHPCPVAIGAGDTSPRWLTLSLRIRVADALVAGGSTDSASKDAAAAAAAESSSSVPGPELWVFDSLIPFPLTPAPPLFRLPFKVSDLRHITGHFFQPRAESWWRRSPGRRVLHRPHLTSTQSNWFYARLSAFAFYVYCVNLPPHAVWGAMRLFFDRVETIVSQKRHLELDADQLERVNPNLHAAWGPWNAQMAMFAYWFVALYQALTICPTVDLAAVRLRSGAVSADVVQDPFQELLAFLYDASQYWPAMQSCQADFSDLEPLLVPVQRVSISEAATRLQSRMCLRDVNAFLLRRLPGEETEAGTVCYRLADMLPSHLRETLVRLGFEAEDVATVVMAPYFVGASESHGYDLFVRMHTGHECAWQAASLCELGRGARPLLQRLGCTSRVSVRNRPSLVRTIRRAIVRLIDTTIDVCAEDATTLAVTTAYATEELRYVRARIRCCDARNGRFIRDICGPQPRVSAALIFLCASGLHVPFFGGATVALRAAVGVTEAHMLRSLKKWRGSLTSAGFALQDDDLTMAAMSVDRFRALVRATAPLLRGDANLNIFIHLACSNPLLGASNELCSTIEAAGELQPALPRLHAYEGTGTGSSAGGDTGDIVVRRCGFRWTGSVLEYALLLHSSEDGSGSGAGEAMTPTESLDCIQAMTRVIETLNAMRRGEWGLAPLLNDDEMQNVGWHQTNEDFALLREREVHARTCGLPARPIAATRSLALFPDQCAMVYASMRNCPSSDDLVAELLMGPDHKCNWDAINASDTHFTIAKAKTQAAPEDAELQRSRVEARAKAHFGEGAGSLLRHNYPESMRAPSAKLRKTTLPMSPTEVQSAELVQNTGRPARTHVIEAAAVAVEPAAPAAAAANPKRGRAPPTAATPRTMQLNCAGKLIPQPGAVTAGRGATIKRKTVTTAPSALTPPPPARTSNLGYAVMAQYMQ